MKIANFANSFGFQYLACNSLHTHVDFWSICHPVTKIWRKQVFMAEYFLIALHKFPISLIYAIIHNFCEKKLANVIGDAIFCNLRYYKPILGEIFFSQFTQNLIFLLIFTEITKFTTILSECCLRCNALHFEVELRKPMIMIWHKRLPHYEMLWFI